MPVQRFAKFFAEEIQAQLAEGDPSKMNQYAVADLVFSFNNRAMLKLLKKRTKYL